MILTTELCVSKESHSGSAPPQPFNKSKTENHHKANGCFCLNGFIGMLTMSDSQSGASRAMHPAVPIRKRRRCPVSEGRLSSFYGVTAAQDSLHVCRPDQATRPRSSLADIADEHRDVAPVFSGRRSCGWWRRVGKASRPSSPHTLCVKFRIDQLTKVTS
jgi:hypothetical protein